MHAAAALPSHMLRETAEAPDVVARMLDKNAAALAEIGRLCRKRRPSHFITCARGSSDHAAAYLKYLLALETGLPCASVGASVVSVYGTRLALRDTIVVSISQSGRSPDLLAFQEAARRTGAPTVAICNDAASPLAEAADICLPLLAGPEVSVAATKSFIASAALAAGIVAAFGGDQALAAALARLPDDLAAALELRGEEWENAIAAAGSLYVLGRGPSLPIAQEAALKLKETCGIHAEGFSAAEVLHGPMELARNGFPVLVFSPADAAAATTAATVARLKAAGAAIIEPAYRCTASALLDPISMIQTFYVGAERLARRLGRDPDRPALLSKITETL